MTNPTTEPAKKGILETLGTIAAEKILPKLVELLWPKLEFYLENRLWPKLAGLVPLAASSAVKAAIDEIPGIDSIRDVAGLVEKVTGDVNAALPDIDIPGISEHFDLTEFLNKTLGR